MLLAVAAILDLIDRFGCMVGRVMLSVGGVRYWCLVSDMWGGIFFVSAWKSGASSFFICLWHLHYVSRE